MTNDEIDREIRRAATTDRYDALTVAALKLILIELRQINMRIEYWGQHGVPSYEVRD